MTWLPLIVFIIVVLLCLCVATDDDEFKKVDVAKLASMTHGTELIVLENAYHGDNKYRLEDFFWTGSGDGATDDDNPWSTEKPSTIYKTKTIVSTVYIENPATPENPNITQKCTHNCEGVQVPEGEINPTATYNQTDEEEYLDADRQFWLLTVLKSDGKDPLITDLKRSLAKLYKTAFQRQQEKHLGITNRTKRDSSSTLDEPVNIYIHDISKIPSDDEENIQVVYHVSVAGKPVLAVTAAEDMSLVSDEEVQTELGYPFVVKAEPYLKSAVPESLSRAKNTWIFIGSSLLILLVLLLLIAFLTLGFTKRKRIPSTGTDNRRQVFDEEGPGCDNKGFTLQEGRKKKEDSPTYINFRHQPSNHTIKSGILRERSRSASSSSIMSGSSLDISPLMGLKVQQRTPPKKPPRPKAALNKTAPIKTQILDSDSSGTQDTIFSADGGIISPKSYLSMPSVKSFPRTNMPEPLNRVLEPVSVLHLDMMDDIAYQENDDMTKRRGFMRHGSVGTMEDPGVIGPVVWNMHQQRLQHGISMDEGIEDFKLTSSVARMRKRFHDLLDDTFSLFGSRRGSPIPTDATSTTKQIDDNLRPRPKSCDPRRMLLTSPSSEPPRGAWMSTTPSPLVRPVSAGPTQHHRPITAPTVNVAHILAEGKMKPTDPAVPLIAAIKTELEKCSLPGSTTDLRI